MKKRRVFTLTLVCAVVVALLFLVRIENRGSSDIDDRSSAQRNAEIADLHKAPFSKEIQRFLKKLNCSRKQNLTPVRLR